MNKSKRCVLYTQISNLDQIKLGYSLEEQKKMLEKYVFAKELKNIALFSRELDSEKKFEIFDKMLKFVRKNEIKIIVFASRQLLNMQDHVDLDAWLNEELSREIHFVDTDQVLSKETRDVKMALDWDIDIDMARYYFRRLRAAVIGEFRKKKS